MNPSRRLSLIAAISKGRVVSGEKVAQIKPLPPILRPHTILLDNRRKRSSVKAV